MTKKLPYQGNAPISEIEDLYKDYLNNPESVEDSWRYFFEGFELARTTYHESEQSDLIFADEFKVINLINAYRMRGHLFTRTNPVRKRRQYFPTLDITNFGLNESDLEKSFKAGNELGIGQTSLKNIVQYLEDTYCVRLGWNTCISVIQKKLNG
jgi:2-oxoglutarate dehydrogenase E1 component